MAYLLSEHGIWLANKNQTKCCFYRCTWICTARVEILNAFPTFSMFAWNVGRVFWCIYVYIYGVSTVRTLNMAGNKNQTKCCFYRCAWICTARVEILNAFPTFSMFTWKVGKVFWCIYMYIYGISTVRTWNITDKQKWN